MRFFTLTLLALLFVSPAHQSLAADDSVKEAKYSIHRIAEGGTFHFRWCDDGVPSDPKSCGIIGRDSGYTAEELQHLGQIFENRSQWFPVLSAAKRVALIAGAAGVLFAPIRILPITIGGSLQLSLGNAVLGSVMLTYGLNCYQSDELQRNNV